MSFLFGAKTKKIPDITGLQIQTAVNVLPIPLLYGSPRVPINIIYVNGFRSAHVTPGGKGLLSSGKGNQQVRYYATFIGAIGEGPLGLPRVIFDDQAVYTPATIPAHKVEVWFNGSDVQTPWSFIVSNFPNDAFSYKDTAYIGFEDYQLDSSATIPQLNYVVDGLFAATSPLNKYTAPDASSWFMDADPALVIQDFLTNAVHGAGFPATYLDTTTLLTSANGFNPAIGDSAVSTYCQAVGFAWSVALNNFEPASMILDRWCKNMLVAPVWTGSILKFIPYWDAFNGTNPGWDATAGIAKKYYAPNIPVLFDLGDADYIQAMQGEDPIYTTRVDLTDVKNIVRVDYRDRSNLFNDNIQEAKDENSVDLFGPRVDRMGTADEFTFGTYASVSAQINLQRNIAVRRTFTFKLPWIFCILDPMDIVTLTDTTLGLNKFAVRIRSIEEDEKGILTIVAEEFPLGAASATLFATQENKPPVVFETNVAPAPVNPPVIFEPTAALAIAQGLALNTVIIGASGGTGGVADPNWGGCNVFLSDDNVTYVQETPPIIGPSRQGLTTATLPDFIGGTNPDNTHTLSVNMTMSGGTLETVTSVQAANGLSLCVIIDTAGAIEFLTYTTSTLTSAGHYDLTGLYRGLYGSDPCQHLSGSQFLRLDDMVFENTLPPQFVGQTFYAKLQSFNIWGQAPQDISTCVAYTFTPNGAGFDPSTNPIASALMAGSSVDLNTASGSLDLNLGGFENCNPVLYTIDLGTF